MGRKRFPVVRWLKEWVGAGYGVAQDVKRGQSSHLLDRPLPQSRMELPGGSVVKGPPADTTGMVGSLGGKIPQESTSRVPAWEIPRTEGPGGATITGSRKAGRD